MIDRFRFRAWSKEEKEYYYNAEQTYDCLTNGIMHDNFGMLLEDDNFIIEQCTGIKDCNGKLIYEGDILRFNGIFIDCCVIFKNGAFEYTIWEENKNSYRLTTVIAKSTQIIGNIHEEEIE